MSGYVTEANIKWAVGIIVPILVTVIGWIYVYLSSQKNMRRDKRITTYISTFNFIREPINEAIQNYSKLSIFILLTSNDLERFIKEDNNLFEARKAGFLKSYTADEFKELKNKATESFIKFVSSWEQYDIVLKPLVRQRYAIQKEFLEVNIVLNEVFTEYNTYFYSISKGGDVPDNARVRLISRLKDADEVIIDFFSCIMDINVNLQNYVFKDFLGVYLEARQVSEINHPTINKLMNKHKL
ncbi:hypothetical protein [Gorillibacterium massiliense]|uniref:hypothetical protein n=1 Tax=Gorillibacterium massiliense TaxID=1280390 RepID=UPI000593D033|nr:hypothetical protein [Gorillibacterium massiliense]